MHRWLGSTSGALNILFVQTSDDFPQLQKEPWKQLVKQSLLAVTFTSFTGLAQEGNAAFSCGPIPEKKKT